MKTNQKLSMIVAVALSMAACNSNQEAHLLVSNPLDQQRNDARILISRNDIAEVMNIPVDKLPYLTDKAGMPVPSQADDLDGDGEWDELLALTDLGPVEEVKLGITFSEPADYPLFKVRTNLRMGANRPGYPELQRAERLEGVTYHNHSKTGKAYQMEGPAWENDMVGFRNYLDQRNGMDIFGKTTSEMVLDSVGIKGRQSYHDPDDWGMDVLIVGTSLGAGSIGYMYMDSIYRVGDSGSGSYEAILEGPLRSRFNLTYENWKLGESNLDIILQIDIVAGRRCFESTVVYSGSDIKADLVAGIVNIESDTLYILEPNHTYTGLITHDYQAEDSALLAMALLVPSAELKKYGESNESGDGITQTYYAVLDASPDKKVPYRFYSLWESEDNRWASLDEVKGFLKEEADRLAKPVVIEFAP